MSSSGRSSSDQITLSAWRCWRSALVLLLQLPPSPMPWSCSRKVLLPTLFMLLSPSTKSSGQLSLLHPSLSLLCLLLLKCCRKDQQRRNQPQQLNQHLRRFRRLVLLMPCSRRVLLQKRSWKKRRQPKLASVSMVVLLLALMASPLPAAVWEASIRWVRAASSAPSALTLSTAWLAESWMLT